MTTEPLIAAIFARKSTAKDVGVARQIEIAKDFAEKEGYVFGGLAWGDDDCSVGAKSKAARPGFDAMMTACESKNRPFDVIITQNDDRLSRGYIDQSVNIQRRIVQTGCKLRYYSDGSEVLFGDVGQEIMIAVKAGLARSQSVETSKNTRKALAQNHKNGHATKRAPFGYHNVKYGLGSDGKHAYVRHEIDDAQAAIVRRIFDLAAEGQGNLMIASQFTREGVQTVTKLKHRKDGPLKGQPKAKTTGWSANDVKRVLDNHLYLGEIIRNGETTVVPDLRIVSQEKWDAVRAVKAARNASAPRASGGLLQSRPEGNYKHLLAGILRCPDCGGAMGYQEKQKEPIAKYRCRGREKGRASVKAKGPCPNSVGIPAAALERYVREAVIEILHDHPETMADVISARQARARAEVETHWRQARGCAGRGCPPGTGQCPCARHHRRPHGRDAGRQKQGIQRPCRPDRDLAGDA